MSQRGLILGAAILFGFFATENMAADHWWIHIVVIVIALVGAILTIIDNLNTVKRKKFPGKLLTGLTLNATAIFLTIMYWVILEPAEGKVIRYSSEKAWMSAYHAEKAAMEGMWWPLIILLVILVALCLFIWVIPNKRNR
ncbi:MAG TPA: hypothetical protein VN370_02850 [Desulfitobacteriaceae bacterium]|nr:hypothetical protein [Desulfitobacteriaceae bacterium]